MKPDKQIREPKGETTKEDKNRGMLERDKSAKI